jgi:mannose-6-phosphate isomerase-like protein (cupin superfamily)
MPLQLEGGCLVAGLREGPTERLGELRIWNHFEGENISLRVIEGRGVIRGEGEEVLYDVNREEGIYLPANEELELDGTYVGVSVAGWQPADRPAGSRRSKLHDQPMQATGDRFYRELIQSDITQFVGSIPPGRAPDHFHLYEEMLCVLDGYGTMWAGETSAPIETGSCIYLPRKQVHCVENRSPAYLRLLGVFYPAGSPAVRYGKDDRA